MDISNDTFCAVRPSIMLINHMERLLLASSRAAYAILSLPDCVRAFSDSGCADGSCICTDISSARFGSFLDRLSRIGSLTATNLSITLSHSMTRLYTISISPCITETTFIGRCNCVFTMDIAAISR